MATPNPDEIEDDVGRGAGTTRARLVRALSRPRTALGVTMGPGTVWIAGLLVAPLVFMLAVSFTTTNLTDYDIIWEPTLARFREMLGGSVDAGLLDGGSVVLLEVGSFQLRATAFEKAILLSYAIATVTTLLCLALAFPLAYLLARRSGPLVKATIFLMLLPFFTMYLVRAYSWVLMFGSNGVINGALGAVGVGPLEVFNYGVPATIIGLTHAYYPYMLLTLYASMDGLDFSLVEAARDLGASRIDVLRDQIIPLTMPGIVGGSLFVFVPSVGAFITPQILGQGKVQMVGILIEGWVYESRLSLASAGSMFVVVSIVAAMVLAFRYVELDELGGA